MGVDMASASAISFGDLVGGRRAAQVGRAGAVVEHAGDGALDRACGGGLPELVEQQRDREDRAGGIGLAAAGDVGRRAVDRLEDAGAAVGERRRGREADAAADGGGEVGEHVAEQVLGHDHVVGGRPLDEQHRHRVDELVLERHARMALGDLARDARQSFEVASTLALSTLVTRPLRRSASTQARSTMRRISNAL